jgi:hypothetical protein
MKCVIDDIVSGDHDWKLRVEITDVKLIRACVSCMVSGRGEALLMNGYALTAHCYGNQCDAVYVKGCNCLDEIQADGKFKTAGGPGASPRILFFACLPDCV